MKFQDNKYVLLLILMASLVGCKPGSRELAQNPGHPGQTGLESKITPSGERLLPAEEGPERSAFGAPSIDLASFTLEITGLVDSSFSMNWSEINSMPDYQSGTMLMYCVEGWEVWGNWEGVRIKDLLALARIRPEGKYITFTCVDGYSTSLPVSYLLKYNALLASSVNGYPLSPVDGYPLRLVAFGKFGYKWAKWVNKMVITDNSEKGFWESLGFPDRADVEMSRRRYYEGQFAQPLNY
jgi:DMSO/TMAO reductase YedYZ molybdopterin-dependent catalytic subunit